MSAIVARQLTRDFGSVRAVDAVDLNVARGELFGIVGPDGAGKTTTIRMLAGVLKSTSGMVRVLGHDPRSAASRSRIGIVPQEHTLYGDLSIAENLAFYGRLFGMRRRTFAERREELLAITRLAPFEDRLARALSGGMYKKLALACALLHQPEIVLLDEPTNGVDPVSRRQLWELLYRFIDEGTTVVISSPYMDEAARCHRVVMMNHGLVLDEGAPGGIVARMRAEAFTTEGGERGALLDALDGLPGMLALSPFGDGLRIVVRADAAPEVARAANALGARLVQARAVFEDAFLARLSEGAAA